MANIWLHRISHHPEVTHPLLDQNILTIGFADFISSKHPAFVDEVISRGLARVDEACDEEWGIRPKTRHNLKRFLQEMKTGDLVLVPKWGTFSLYRLKGDKAHPISELPVAAPTDWHHQPLKINGDDLLVRLSEDSSEEVIDLGFFWKVEPLALGISREQYADAALTARMKYRMTTVKISDLNDSIEKARKAHEAGKPINLHAQITAAAVAVIRDEVRGSLNPDKLERLVQWYLKRVGASDVYIPSKNEADKEGDADVIATFEPLRLIIYVQAKFHQGETSTWALDQINAYRNKKDRRENTADTDTEYSHIRWVVSTGDRFSEDCRRQAAETNVRLIDGERFAAMLLEAGIAGLDAGLNR